MYKIKDGQYLFYSRLIVFVLVLGSAMGCSSEEKSDAYGQFEATEITVSSEASGTLLNYGAEEGIVLKAGRQVGQIDSTKQVLQRRQLEAKLSSVESKIDNINAEVDVRRSELENAEKDLQRYRSLVKERAATPKQLEDVEARYRTLRKQVDALQTQKRSVRAEITALRVQIEQLEEELEDTRIVNPVYGTVLTSFVESYEVIQRGQPLYRIANLDTLLLRVYISGAQLPEVKLGQQAEVLVDKNARENHRLDGRVSWIASEAEFTPRQIQTKEERVTQVYAVKVRVPNPEGMLKIGMPGEVNF